MKTPPEYCEYAFWQGELTAAQCALPAAAKSYPTVYQDHLLYLQRYTAGLGDSACDGKTRVGVFIEPLPDTRGTTPKGFGARCLLPSEMSAQIDIHEYGGKPFWLWGDLLVFVNAGDRALYQIDLTHYHTTGDLPAPKRISPLAQTAHHVRYADAVPYNAQFWLAIAEFHSQETQEPVAAIVLIDTHQINKAPTVLVSGADFYANLVIDDQRTRVAWFEWQHPVMPWSANRAVMATLDASDSGVLLTHQQALPEADAASYCQLCFANDALHCVVDFADCDDTAKDIWNVYQVQTEDATLIPLTDGEREFGYPHWQFGDQRLVGNARVLCGCAASPDGDAVWVHSQTSGQSILLTSAATIEALSLTDLGHLVFLYRSTDAPARIALLDLSADSALVAMLESKEVDQATLLTHIRFVDPEPTPLEFGLSAPVHVAFGTQDQQTAYGFYYPPASGNFTHDSAPPLLVMVHGGPTARAYSQFDLHKQFWTNHGFAILDVNHRGSSGYGRRYRDALWGQWGVLDGDDVIDGVNHLIQQGRAHPAQIFIRGKSAGGFTVLSALTRYPEVFAAGASYYGIGDLATLAQTTHKFERFYTDLLIGETYTQDTSQAQRSAYRVRSPIHHLDSIKAPMIIFQGSEDKVVPPQLSRTWVASLEQRGLAHEYHEFDGQGHGFKDPDIIEFALKQELKFYRQVLAQSTKSNTH